MPLSKSKMANKISSNEKVTQHKKQFEKTKLTFHCQQAHGSPTGIISGFTNVQELYEKIASCYEIETNDVSIT